MVYLKGRLNRMGRALDYGVGLFLVAFGFSMLLKAG